MNSCITAAKFTRNALDNMLEKYPNYIFLPVYPVLFPAGLPGQFKVLEVGTILAEQSQGSISQTAL